MAPDFLREQLAYYQARAQEYDASLQTVSAPSAATRHPADEEWARAMRAVQQLGPCATVLELAGGTGLWTQALAQLTPELTVLDGAPEMLALNRAKVGDPRVRYECVDLFAWEPTATYDLVFCAFWLSHVPPVLLNPFLDKLQQAVRPGGRVCIIDEPAGGQKLSGPTTADDLQQRVVQDGRTFTIVKVYYAPAALQAALAQRGFAPQALEVGAYFFYLLNERLAAYQPAHA